MSKYRIPVVIETIASKYIGTIECESLKEYKEKSRRFVGSARF